MADDDDGVASQERGLAHVERCRPGRKPLVDLRLTEPERRRRLSRAQQGARDHRVGREALGAEAPAELAGVLAAGCRERAELVRIPGGGFGVTDDQQPHTGQDSAPSLRTRPGTVAVVPLSWLGPSVGAAAFALTVGTAWDQGGFHPVSWDLPLVGLAALSLASVFLVAPPRPGRYAAGAVGALAFLALWNAASWLWSDSPPAALEESQRVALYAVAAAAVAIAGRRVPRAWIAGGVVLGVVPVACRNLADPGSNGQPVGYANGLAVLIVLAILLLLGFASTPRPLLWRAVSGLLIVPLAWDLVLQRSTGGDAVLGAGLLVFALVAPWRGRRVQLRIAAAVATLILVVALAAAPFALHGHVRGSYWRVALHEYAAKPVLGSGAGTFVDWWTRIRTTPGSTEEAHSLYIETLAELGPVGLLAVLAALGVPLVAAFRLRSDPLGPALLAALVAFDVHAAVDFDWELAGVTLPAVLLGVSAAVHADPQGTPLHVRSRGAAATVLAIVGTAAVLALAGNERLASAQNAEAAGRFPAAVAGAHSALRYAPWSADAWRVIGESLRVQGDRAGAAAAFRSATKLDPNDWETWSELAGVSTGEPRRAAEAEAARLNPLAGR